MGHLYQVAMLNNQRVYIAAHITTCLKVDNQSQKAIKVTSGLHPKVGNIVG
jgi:hypothetical protein